MALGDFEITTEAYTSELVFYLLFTISTIITMIILLNMIIAVMSLSFSKVSDENEAFIYREKLIIL